MRLPELETERIKGALRRIMRQRDLTYADLAAHLDVSLATVKRVLTSEELTVTRLMSICRWLDLSLAELAAATEESEERPYYTEKQEQFLAADTRYLTYLFHLYDGWTPERIAAEYGLTPASTDRYLRKLEQIDLVRVTAQGRVVTTHRSQPIWISGGELSRSHYGRVVERYAGYFVKRKGEGKGKPVFTTSGISAMSQETYDALRRELKEAMEKAQAQANVEFKLRGEEKLGKGVYMVCDTWLEPGTQAPELENMFGEITNL